MKVMIISFVAVLVIALGANVALSSLPFSASDATVSPSVRLD
ncbi:hypothetical protein [Pseudogemmobacter sp. W21_MBD1_M6]